MDGPGGKKEEREAGSISENKKERKKRIKGMKDRNKGGRSDGIEGKKKVGAHIR